MPTVLSRDVFVHLKQHCNCHLGMDSQSRLSIQMMTAMTGHCTHPVHALSSAQVIFLPGHFGTVVVGFNGCCAAQHKLINHWLSVEESGSRPVHTLVHALSAAQS